MKIIEAKTWRTLSRFVAIGAVPLVLLDFFEAPGSFGRLMHVMAFPLLVTMGVCGGLVAVLERRGVVQFRYSEEDKRRLHYRLAKRVAEEEHRMRYRFSSGYFATYGLPQTKEEPNQPPEPTR